MSLLCSPHNMCATLFSNVFSVCKVNGPPPDASQLSPALKNIICFFENIFCFAIHHWIQGMHSEHRPKTFYKNPNVRMVIWEWDWERVGLLVGCEKRELLCRKGRVSDRWGKWSVCVTAVNHQNVCTTWVHQCLRHQCVHRLGAAHPFKVVQSTNLHHLHCTTNIFIEGSRDKLGKTIAIHHSWEPAKCSKCGHNLWLTRESSRNCCCPTTTPTPLPSIHCSCSSGPSSAFTGVATHTWYTSPVQSYFTCTATIAANMVDHCFAIYFCYFTNTHPGSNTNHWACKLQHVQLFLLDLIFKLYL